MFGVEHIVAFEGRMWSKIVNEQNRTCFIKKKITQNSCLIF